MKIETRTTLMGMLLVVAVLLIPSVDSLLAAADEGRYVSITIRGRLTDPETDNPMVNATIRFTPIEEGEPLLGITDENGHFFVSDMTYDTYIMEIETAEGETIRGINNLELDKRSDEAIEITLHISDRYESETSLGIQAERWAAIVEAERINWRIFWKEFFAFMGATAGLGLAAL